MKRIHNFIYNINRGSGGTAKNTEKKDSEEKNFKNLYSAVTKMENMFTLFSEGVDMNRTNDTLEKQNNSGKLSDKDYSPKSVKSNKMGTKNKFSNSGRDLLKASASKNTSLTSYRSNENSNII